MSKYLLLIFSTLFISCVYSSEIRPQFSGSFFKRYADSISNSKSKFVSGDEGDIDNDGNLEGIIYSLDMQGNIKSAFLIRYINNSFQSIGTTSKIDGITTNKFISSKFVNTNIFKIKYILSEFKDSDNNSTELLFELVGNNLKVIKNSKGTSLKFQNKRTRSFDNNETTNFINDLTGYKFYKGYIEFENRDNNSIELKREILYYDNNFYYPERADSTAEFWVESVILGIPRDINLLSENRTMLDRSILNSISKLKTSPFPYKIFKSKEVYNVRGKSVVQLEFDFDNNKSDSVFFLTLNNRTGQWRVESISIKKPFLTTR